jgi:hypothetical protein
MTAVPRQLAAGVERRARGRCEYCQLSQSGQEARFHIDHVVPLAAGGRTVSDNLALACVSCSLRKGAKRESVDPQDGANVGLFNPRTLIWSEHFVWDGLVLSGLTATGRATVAALAMNRPLIIAIRAEEQFRGRFP